MADESRLSVSLPIEVKSLFEQLSEERRVSMAELVREAVLAYAHDQRWKTTIADRVLKMLQAGKTNEAIAEAIRAADPTAATTTASVAWYRSRYRNEGQGGVPTNAEAKARGG